MWKCACEVYGGNGVEVLVMCVHSVSVCACVHYVMCVCV